MTHLLDTNAWIAYLRKKTPHIIAHLAVKHPSDLALGSVVLAELYYGAYHGAPNHLSANLLLVEQLRQTFPVVSFDAKAAEAYGKLREDLGSRGLLIGPNDLMIAAIALANGLTLVTNNTSEFSRVIGLALEDWQIP